MRGLASCRLSSVAGISAGLFFFVLMLFDPAAGVEAASSSRAPRILILYPNDEHLPATTIGGEAARKRLIEATKGNVELFSEFLDLSRFREEGHIANMARYLAAKYAPVHPDVIIALGPASIDFILAHRQTIAPEARIVYTGTSKVEASGMDLPAGVFGALTEFDITRTVEMARGLQPDARQLVVFAGSSPFDKSWLDAARQDLGPITDIEKVFVSDLTKEEFVERASKLPADTILLILTVFKDSSGADFIPRDVAAEIAKAATAPSYGPYSTYLGLGIVGTSTFTFETMGAEVADLALDALAGKSMSDIVIPQTYLADARELKRWGLAEGALPPGTVISFDEKSLWELHHETILATLGVLALQAFIIGALLIERRRRTVAEGEARSRLLEVVHLNQSATAGALSASIAHELNQPLGAIRNNARAAELLLNSADPNLDLVKQILADIRDDDQRASEIIGGLRSMLKKRSEIEWQELDVNEVVANALQILHGEAERRRVAVDFRRPSSKLPVRADRVHLQQVILNIATNAMDAMLEQKVADRKLTFNTTIAEPGQVGVSVVDTGAGIPPEKLARIFETFYTTKTGGTGLGLSIARAVVESYGGRIWAENRPGGGAKVSFTLPMVEA